jgi:hypothetical protein
MGNNNAEVIIKTRRHVDRRRVEERRLSLKQEYLDHKPERRVNMTNRRISGDRRGVVPDIINTFWKEAL